jgi:hypothetical protein
MILPLSNQKTMTMKKQRVIDGDNMRMLEFFAAEDTNSVLARYRAMGKWDEVEVDGEGDVILYKEE